MASSCLSPLTLRLRYCVWKLADVTEQKAGKGRLLNRIQEAESMEATDFLRSSEESYRVLGLKHPGQETDYDLMKTTLTLARLVLSETNSATFFFGWKQITL